MAWTTPSTFTVGQVLRALDMNNISGDLNALVRTLDYAQITSNVSSSVTSEGSATTLITGNSVTYDGSTVLIQFYSPQYSNTVAGSAGYVIILRDSTVLGRLGQPSGGSDDPYNGWIRDTPSAAAHTYSAKLYVSTGTGTIFAGAGGATTLAPAFLQVFKP